MTTNRCHAELCSNWTGSGCICEVLDLEPENDTPGFCLTGEHYCVPDCDICATAPGFCCMEGPEW
jgi:hypothetical protein